MPGQAKPSQAKPYLTMSYQPVHIMILQVEMQLPGAGWGVLNITSAGLEAWSFTDTVTFAASRVHPEASLVLHCGRMPSSYHGIVACS